ncbi:hypothetical protein LCGC14_2315480 [marine sediment metagenome]|uniref:SWIM-type domain-containing protein n=1 Tax=marine sediment metagenome TaxID=412755 RepID=A0A0F9D6Z8_9ZZZZ
MAEFEVNRYITLKLEDEKTNIYINDKHFILCKRLLINIPYSKIESFDHNNSLDEIAVNSRLTEQIQNSSFVRTISPEEEFMAHCSNLQAWAENDFDTDILHSNIAFPLLKKLTELGYHKARRVFKEEIVRRCLGGYEPVLIFLVQAHYLELLNDEELIFLSKILEPKGKSKLSEIIADTLKKDFPEKVKQSFYRILLIFDGKLAKNMLYVEYGEERFFVNDNALYLTGRSKLYRIKSLMEIKGLNKLDCLSSLTIQDHSLSKINGLEKLFNLESLDLSSNNIKSISGLSECSKLKALNLGDNKIKEINNIEFLSRLENLSLSSNKITKIAGLHHLKNLKSLSLGDNEITKIEGLDNLINLESLDISRNNITKIEGLDNLVNLKTLYMYGNELQFFVKDPLFREPFIVYQHKRGSWSCSCPYWIRHNRDCVHIKQKKIYRQIPKN